MNDIMKNIKKLRQKKNMTQEELAEKLYVTRQAVSNWETGKNQPDIDTLEKLAEVLEVEVTELLYGPAPDPNRRKKIVVTAVLCVLATVFWVVYTQMKKWAAAMMKNQYRMEGAALTSFVVGPLTLLLSGAAIAALLTLGLNIRPIKAKLRRGMLAAGTAITLFWAVLAWWEWFGGSPFKWTARLLHAWYGAPWTLVLLGSLLFWGWPRKAG